MDIGNGDETQVVDNKLAHSIERLCLLLAASSQRDAIAEAHATATMAQALQAAAKQSAASDFVLPHSCFTGINSPRFDNNLRKRETNSKIGPSTTVANVAAKLARDVLAPLLNPPTAAIAASKVMNRNRLEALVLACPTTGVAFCEHRLVLARSAQTQLLASLALGVAVATDVAVAAVAAARVTNGEPAPTAGSRFLLESPASAAVARAVAAPLEALLAIGAFVALTVASHGGSRKDSPPSEDKSTLSCSAGENAATANPLKEETTTAECPLNEKSCTTAKTTTKATVPATAQHSVIGALRDPRVAGALAAMEDVGASGPRRTLVGHLLLPASTSSARTADMKGSAMDRSSSSSSRYSSGGNESSMDGSAECNGSNFGVLALDVAIERDRATPSTSSSSSLPVGSTAAALTDELSGGRPSSPSPHPPPSRSAAGQKGGAGGAAWTTPGFRLLLTKDRKTLAYVLTEVTTQQRPTSADVVHEARQSSATLNASPTSSSSGSGSSSNSKNEGALNATSTLRVEWCLRGMQVDPSLRGRGLSKLLLGLWLILARKCGAKIGPTRRIKKPLVAWALQCWGFEPLCPTAAVHVELASPPISLTSSSSSMQPVVPTPTPMKKSTCSAPPTSSPRDDDFVLSSDHQASGTPLSLNQCRKRQREGVVVEEDRESIGIESSMQADIAPARERHEAETPPCTSAWNDEPAQTCLSKNERKRRAKAEALAAKKAAKRARVAGAGESEVPIEEEEAVANQRVAAAVTSVSSPAAAYASPAAACSAAAASTALRQPATSSMPPPPPVVLWTPDRARVVSVLSKSELAAQGLCLSPDWPPPPGWARKAVTLNACFALPSAAKEVFPNGSDLSNSGSRCTWSSTNKDDNHSGSLVLYSNELQQRLAELFEGSAHVTATCASAPQPLATPLQPAALRSTTRKEGAGEADKEANGGMRGVEQCDQSNAEMEMDCNKRLSKPVLMLYAAKLLQATSAGQWAVNQS